MGSFDVNSNYINFVLLSNLHVMKFSTRSYMQPTPRNLRHFGDGLLGIGTTITGAAIASGNDILAYVSLGFGVIGKFLTNFFAE